MSLTKAAAVITLIVTLTAAGYLVYESTMVRARYKAASSACMTCTVLKEAVAANWRLVESNIESLKAKRKYREAERFAQEHAGEKPINVDAPCEGCETPAPDYNMPSAVTVVGLIASAVLFGAVKPRK